MEVSPYINTEDWEEYKKLHRESDEMLFSAGEFTLPMIEKAEEFGILTGLLRFMSLNRKRIKIYNKIKFKIK